ncbi:MAG TPA: hypothetical protein VGK88_12415 [bacterium]
MKRTIVLMSVLLLAVMALPVFAEVPADLVPTCVGRSGSITVAANLQTLAAALEVELFLENTGTVSIRLDPSKTVLRTNENTLSAWTADQAKQAHRDIGAYILAGALFPPLLAITGVTQLNFNRYVDSRAFHTIDMPAGGTARGSIFFPMPPESAARAELELGGLTPDSGALLPVRMYCALPRGASAQVAANGFAPLTVSLGANGSNGAAAVTVEAVEFASDYTAVEIRISNKADTQAEIFGAMVNASLQDGSGAIYAGRPARSDFGNRILAKQTVSARLVFDPLPLPPITSKAALTIPRVWFGPEDAVDVTVVLQF